MKRSSELRDLSEQHHYGLVAARTLRLAAEASTDVAPAVASFLRTWEAEIQPHFQSEEAVLLPAYAAAEGDDDSLIVRTLVEHVRLRRLIREMATAPGPRLNELAAEVARALHDHIRFEERELFPAIESTLVGERLADLGRALHPPPPRQCSLPATPEADLHRTAENEDDAEAERDLNPEL